MIKKSFLIFFVFLVIACSNNDTPIVAFYYWKTVFKLSQAEKEVLENNSVTKLYVRYFDIGLRQVNAEPIPLSPIHFLDKVSKFDIVPVVFIQNKVMLKSDLDVDDLARKTLQLVTEINTKNKIYCREIQIDCDWTLASKENYLKFVERVKKRSHKQLSATIRLHQVKYFKRTKIPNVDSGVLMYYNMGTITADSANSIYNHKIAEKYLESLKKYPLHLDIALPIYSWAIHIRNQKVIGLRSKLDVTGLRKDQNFEQLNTLFFKVKKSNYKNGFFYEQGDLLKIETISAEDLKTMGKELSANVANTPKEIIFYDLDEFNLKNYEKNIFEQVVSCF